MARGDFNLIEFSFSGSIPSISSLAALSVWEPRILLSYCFAPFAWSKTPLGWFFSQAVGCHLKASWGSRTAHFHHIPLAVSHVTICSEARKCSFSLSFCELNWILHWLLEDEKKNVSCMCEKAVHFLIIGYRILFVVIRSSLLIVLLILVCPTLNNWDLSIVEISLSDEVDLPIFPWISILSLYILKLIRCNHILNCCVFLFLENSFITTWGDPQVLIMPFLLKYVLSSICLLPFKNSLIFNFCMF